MELKIKNLSKTYSNGVQALKHITLDIPQGMFGLLGPNGAGMTVKSPLILEKVWVKPGKSIFKYTTKKLPIKAGIDPYNKMIDRIPDDNVMTVEKL